jgi:hypothetical protein
MSTLRVDEISARTGSGNVVMAGGKLVSSGSVLQVVQTVYKDTFATSIGDGWADVSSLNCSITPTSTSSKMLVSLALCGGFQYYQYKVRLVRNGSTVTGALGNLAGVRPQSWITNINYSGGSGNTIYDIYSIIGEYLDSPASTALQTYGIQIGGYSTSFAVYVNRSNVFTNTTSHDATPVSTLTVMEIAG